VTSNDVFRSSMSISEETCGGVGAVSEHANPPLTGKQFDFTKTYFGHDFAFACALTDGHSEPDVHRIVGWSTPQPEVGDVLIGRIHRADGSNYTGRLVVLEIEHHENPPDYFSAVVRTLPGQ
jgi:hypothetical protein